MPSSNNGEYVVEETINEPEARNSHIWLLVVIVAAVSACMVLYGLYHSNEYENDLAVRLSAQFHGIMSEHDWDRIYSEADSKFKEKYTESNAVAMLSSVSARLGNPATCKVLSKHMSRGDDGSYFYGTFETSFTNEQRALEHISWHETDGIYKLDDYEITPEGK